jgi:predicted TIM-barrel fold metal-dependent hydrolase
VTAVAPTDASRRSGASGTDVAVVDCDVHTAPRAASVLGRYLPERWRLYHETYGGRTATRLAYPRAHPRASRSDSFPADGPPGSDLAVLREQLLDRYAVSHAIMTPIGLQPSVLHRDYGAALAAATNEWQAAEWLEADARLRASIIIAHEAPDLAADEIRRRAPDRRFVQAFTVIRSLEPFGQRRYWPIYDAASEAGLPIAFHFGYPGGGPATGAGWPSFYYEDHGGMPAAFEAQLASFVFSGAFDRFPELRVVLVEGGFGWLPPLVWRMERAVDTLGAEVSHLQRRPAEYVREHVWLTTQPMEEPRELRFLERTIRSVGVDRLLFATDYPHWDFDDPEEALPVALPASLRRAVLAENARVLYRLD